MIYSFNYCSFLKERSTHFNAASTVTTVKIAEIISGIKKKKTKACGLMRHKNAGTFFLFFTTDQDEWPEDSTLLLEILLLIYVVFVLYVKKGSLVW